MEEVNPTPAGATAAPPCSRLGNQCRSIRVTLRVGSLEEGNASLDHEATWLLGHTQHITFGELWEDQNELYVEAALQVPCRFLSQSGREARCLAYGYHGAPPRGHLRTEQPRQLGHERFLVVDHRRPAVRVLREPRRSLPVLPAAMGGNGPTAANPCAGAPCRTSDNRRGAACCRDLQIEIMCTRGQRRLEALVRSRRRPYLCKVSRPGDFSLEAEMISACGYLEAGGVACTLHGRLRPDGRPAKPDLCSEWPPKSQELHPGCVFASRRGRRAAG